MIHLNLDKAWRSRLVLIAIMLLALVSAAGNASATASIPIVRVSVATDSSQASGGGTFDGNDVAVSQHGRWVAYDSAADTLVPNDTNAIADIFVRDTANKITERVSVAPDGSQANGSSTRPAITPDGRYVAFESTATNLVADDANGVMDVFVHDMQSHITVSVSVSSAGVQANLGSGEPQLSADGRYVAFSSMATNLVPGDTSPLHDIYVHDRDADADGIYDEPGAVTTVRISLSSSGAEADRACLHPFISATGRYVTFWSSAGNLLPGDIMDRYKVYLVDRDTDADGIFDEAGFTSINWASVKDTGGLPNANSGNGASPVSADGRYVAFESDATDIVSGDTNARTDIFVRETVGLTTWRVSVASDGAQANGRASQPHMSGDGRYVVFMSQASNLVAGDTNGWGDVFLHDTSTHATTRVSLAYDGAEGNEGSLAPKVADNGCCVAFLSNASNLVLDDTNGKRDAFIYGPLPAPEPPPPTYKYNYLAMVMR